MIKDAILWATYRGGSRIDCRGGVKYTARVSAREILCATPTFDVIPAHDMLYEEKVNKENRGYNNIKSMHRYKSDKS